MKLDDALREAEAPGERHAEERAWEAVAAAHAAREPARRRHAWWRALAAAAAAAVLVAVALTPPGEAVADWLARTVDPPKADPAPRPLALPAPGRLLLEVPGDGLAVVDAAGRTRRIGRWADAAWSPRGLFVIAVRGGTLAALDPRGKVRWRLERRTPVAQPAWSNDGFKVAYRSGGDLRVVAGDGTGDRPLVTGVQLSFAGPAWQPGKGYALAWADRAGRVHLLDVFTGRELWRTAPGPPVRMLRWSRTGSTLAAVSGKTVRLLSSQRGRELRRVRARGHDSFEAAAFSPRGSARLALVRHDVVGGGSRVTILPGRTDRPEEPLFAGEGRIADLTYSPDGEWLLLGWRGADQWLFLRRERVEEVRAIAAVTRQVAPEAGGRWAFPAIRGWAPPAP